MPSATLSIVPQPPRPGLYLIQGPPDLIPWAQETLTQSFSPRPIVWIDAANRFNAHWISVIARSLYKDPVRVLSSYHIARPFTAYQLEAMVTQKLLPAAQRYRADFSVIADPLGLYVGAEGRDTQVQQSYDRFIAGLRHASAALPLVILAPDAAAEDVRRGAARYFPAIAALATFQRRLNIAGEAPRLEEA